ncbi:peptide chain release factor PrfB3, chloroplastic isoform X2 [Elaeis guineensis]|uniref:Peptide chain release factor PrfB3, chloroplastic isoform X1 n=1 Tax=Elaeis guineensis var. tenera TaxID=51953 RepID=A0A6I9S702_ELAGV|nr:peptide chain release factor PrfB3, chloroplastic isoform X1 [Elaeis guineensis]
MTITAVGSGSVGKAAAFWPRWLVSGRSHLFFSVIRASHSMESRNGKVYKEIGLYSLKKKIEDVVSRAEMIAPTALECEEARRIKQEKVLRDYDLWDDLARSNESLADLADAIKVVNDLKDLRCKIEDAKLITQLAEMDVINHQLFQEAYNASVDVSKFLDRYEISKLLSGPYDKEGACVIIKAGPEGITSEVWAKKLLSMYTRWAEKHGCEGRIIEKCSCSSNGIRLATIEFESEYFFGYLSGEKGMHRMICTSLDGSIIRETCSAAVDVIPLCLERAIDMHIDDHDLKISSSPSQRENQSGYRAERAVCIHHLPSGITVQSSGERSYFANRIKAMNRLKAKLLILAMDQGVLEPNKIKRDTVVHEWNLETRRYVFHPQKLVQDMRTGIQLPDLNSVLDGNIEQLIRAHINLRQGKEMGQ